MRPVEQEFPHDPERGVFGDCFRASLASLLELSISEVPHFLHDGAPNDVWLTRINAFLAPRGLCLMSINAKDWDFDAWREGMRIEEMYHLISGPSPRFPGQLHSVVGRNGEVAHDPHPDKTGLAGTRDEWSYDLLVRLNTGEAR